MKKLSIPKIGPARLGIPINSYLWGSGNRVGQISYGITSPRIFTFPAYGIRTSWLKLSGAVSKLFCEHFAYAEGYDESTERYLGLITAGGGSVVIDSSSVIVKPDVAKIQEEADKAARTPTPSTGEGGPSKGEGGPVKFHRLGGAGNRNPRRLFSPSGFSGLWVSIQTV